MSRESIIILKFFIVPKRWKIHSPLWKNPYAACKKKLRKKSTYADDPGEIFSRQFTQARGTKRTKKAKFTWAENDPPLFFFFFSRTKKKQVTGSPRPRDHAVTSELALLVNANDNKASIRCEASNSATQVPLVQTVTLIVHCEYRGVIVLGFRRLIFRRVIIFYWWK